MTTSHCHHCGSDYLLELDCPPPHYKKLVCGDCDLFLRWLPKPQNLERSLRLLDQLRELQTKDLNGWEAEFVSSLIDRCEESLSEGKAFSLSPKQLDRLVELTHQKKTNAPHKPSETLSLKYLV